MFNVLLIDNDPMDRDIISKYIKGLDGFLLLNSFDNIKNCKDFILQNQIDLILIDIHLSKEEGLGFIKWVRKKGLDIAIIVITSDKSSSHIREALRFGTVDYIVKPFTYERLKMALNCFKERRAILESKQTLSQEELDNLFLDFNSNLRSEVSDKEYMCKGFNRYTYNTILNFIKENYKDYFSADEISEECGLAVVTVRRYLEYMKEEDVLVKITEYRKIGRPQNRYKLL